MKASSQLTLPELESYMVLERDKALLRYLQRHHRTYIDNAKAIVPDVRVWEDIWDRFAFAILTANTLVGFAHAAFHTVREMRGHFPPDRPMPGITRDRLRYVNALPKGPDIFAFMKQREEPWHDYRVRLEATVEGLGFTKATYAVCLLYPLAADVACIDTWMQRLYYHTTSYEDLTRSEYLEVEGWLRTLSVKANCKFSTALMQWAAWDFARTGCPTDQRFFDHEP